MKRLLIVSLFGVAGLATAALAAPADVVRTRIAGFREMGAAFKAVNDGLRGDPQMILIQQSARQIRNAANQMPGWFPQGSGAEAGVKTAAKPEIWSQPARFTAAREAFIAQAASFQAAANSGNARAIGAEARKLGGTCKGCHETFRARKD